MAFKRKYFSPVAYLNKAKLLALRHLFPWELTVKAKINVGSHSIIFLTNSYLEYFLRAQYGYKRESVTVRWIQETIKSSDTVFDVGANVGTFSLLMGKMVETGGGSVYAFEPEASNFLSLNRNILANNLSSTVSAFGIACADKLRKSELFLSSLTPGASLHGIDAPRSEGKEFSEQYSQGILVCSLDELVFELGIPFPNHIKIDVDGAEGMVVDGMTKILMDHRLRSILIELDLDLDGEQIRECLEKHGFKEVAREQFPGKSVYNVVFVKSSIGTTMSN